MPLTALLGGLIGCFKSELQKERNFFQKEIGKWFPVAWNVNKRIYVAYLDSVFSSYEETSESFTSHINLLSWVNVSMFY